MFKKREYPVSNLTVVKAADIPMLKVSPSFELETELDGSII